MGGIIFAQGILQVDHLIIEGDCTTVIFGIREAMGSMFVHPLIRDIALLLHDYSAIIVRHVYQEANSTMDWVAFFVANHSSNVLWTCLGEAFVPDTTLSADMEFI